MSETFNVRMPDGTVFENVPVGTTKEQIRAKWIELLSHEYSPTEGMSTGEKFAAGAGKAVYDVGRGAGQLVGAVSREDVASARESDAALMETTAGKVGNFVGNVALIAPTSFIPGANKVPGAAAVGAGLGLLQPSTSTRETVMNAALGTGAGAGGQYLGQKVAQAGTAWAAKRAAAAADRQAGNAVRDTTLAEARKAGFQFSPATINPDSVIARATESLAGKAATPQLAAWKNQQVVNRLVRKELGLSKNAPLTKKTLDGIRSQAGKVYAAVEQSGRIVPDQQYLTDIANLGSVMDDVAKEFPGAKAPSGDAIRELADSLFQPEFSAQGAVKYVRELRNQAKAGFKAVNAAEGGAERLALARAQWEAAGALDDMILRHLENSGQKPLAVAFEKARTTIAKAHSAESALSPQGNIVASKLLAQWRRGKPLSPAFDLIARVAGIAPAAVKETTSSPGVNALTAGLATGTGLTGVALGHPEVMLAAAAVPVARLAAQRAVLSRPVQSLVTPSYTPSMFGPRALTGVGGALDPVALAYLWSNSAQK